MEEKDEANKWKKGSYIPGSHRDPSDGASIGNPFDGICERWYGINSALQDINRRLRGSIGTSPDVAKECGAKVLDAPSHHLAHLGRNIDPGVVSKKGDGRGMVSVSVTEGCHDYGDHGIGERDAGFQSILMDLLASFCKRFHSIVISEGYSVSSYGPHQISFGISRGRDGIVSVMPTHRRIDTFMVSEGMIAAIEEEIRSILFITEACTASGSLMQ